MIVLSTPENAKTCSRLAKDGKLKQLIRGVYVTTNTKDEALDIKSKMFEILTYLKIDAVLSYSTALEADSKEFSNTLWLTSSTERKLKIGDFQINVLRANIKEANLSATTVIDKSTIRMPNFYRIVLQNFSSRKVDEPKVNKDLAFNELVKLLNKSNGEYKWELVESNLTHYGQLLGYDTEALEIIKKLNEYKKTNSLDNLDIARANLFENLFNKIELDSSPILKDFDSTNINASENMAFIESYFSNYIEGTEFEVGEAYSIVFDPTYKYKRHKDGHDIKSTYELMLDNIKNPVVFTNATQYIEQLKLWHIKMLSHRSDDMLVGSFKESINKAGSTVFVAPEKVEIMLRRSFEMSQNIAGPIQKAFFLKTAFTEIHPFEDGNGRLSRIILNNFLSLSNKKRIIIPNVFRDDYITALKAFSNKENVTAIIKVLNRAILITNEIDYNQPRVELLSFLRSKSAFEDPRISMWGHEPPSNSYTPSNPGQLDLFSSIASPTPRPNKP